MYPVSAYLYFVFLLFFFFFQAEDGIRDTSVTGVQTCALPICIVDWEHELWSNGHSSRPGRADDPALLAAWHLARPHKRPSAINMPLPAGAADRNAVPIYDFPSQRVVNHYVSEMPVRTSARRSLGAYANVFAIESFMDELAQTAGIDPIAFRLRILKDPRGLSV